MNPTFKQVTKTRYVQQVAEMAHEIFVQHYKKLTPKVAAALADRYQSDVETVELNLLYLSPLRPQLLQLL